MTRSSETFVVQLLVSDKSIEPHTLRLDNLPPTYRIELLPTTEGFKASVSRLRIGLIMVTHAQGGSGMLSRQQLASILGEVSRGDRVAFTRLYEASSQKLYAIVLRIVGRRDLADDLLHRIWQQAAQFNSLRSSPMTWMATIARN